MKKRIVLTLIFSQLVILVYAQLPPSGGSDTAVPLDPGLGILLISSAVYSVMKLNRNEKK